MSAYLWEDAYTLLFTADRGEGKKEREAGEDYTAFYRLDTRGGEAVRLFGAPFRYAGGRPGRGRTLLRADWDLRFSKAYAMKAAAKEALLAEKKEEQDYQVLDELPFYANGGGLPEQKALRPVPL